MTKITSYINVVKRSSLELDKEVDALISDGWVPFGNLIADIDGVGTTEDEEDAYGFFIQTMVMYEEPKGEA